MFPTLYKLVYGCVLFAIFQYSVKAQSITEISSESIANQNIRSFMSEKIEYDEYVFATGEFPKFKWKNEASVKKELGEFPLIAKYFNGDFQEVLSANKPGRYGAIIQGTTSAGFIIQRFVTLYCSNVEFDDYSKNVPIKMNQLHEYGIDDEKWAKYSKNEEHFSFGSLKFFPRNNADAAIFLAGLNDMDDLSNSFDTPRIRDRQWWITMNGKLLVAPFYKNPLQLPQKVNDESYSHQENAFSSLSNYSEEKISNLRKICGEWAEKGKAPHVALVVHKGKIIFYEAFGVDETGTPAVKDTRMWMASITKLLTGVLIMQFVDQGIVELDEFVGKYLSELNDSGIYKLKVRHLFNHTNGLHFAGEWASDWNYSLENQIAHVLPSVDVGKTFSYHRAGYAIAGKIMERITGRAIPYLFQDYIFSPLGMKTAYSDNTYGGLYCTAEDLAKLGQMLLNGGIFNGVKILSYKSFKAMLPQKLDVDNRKWGIGISPKKGKGLSEMAFGHGAASGTLFCVDPENDLIIISARNKPGKMNDEFEKDFIEKCTELIKNN